MDFAVKTRCTEKLVLLSFLWQLRLSLTHTTNWLKQKLLGKRGWYQHVTEGRRKQCACHSLHLMALPQVHCRAPRVGSLKHRASSERLCFPTNRNRHWLCFGNKHFCPSSARLDAHTQLPPQLAGSVQAAELTSLPLLYINFAAEMSFESNKYHELLLSNTKRTPVNVFVDLPLKCVEEKNQTNLKHFSHIQCYSEKSIVSLSCLHGKPKFKWLPLE